MNFLLLLGSNNNSTECMAEGIPISRGLEVRETKVNSLLKRLETARHEATTIYRETVGRISEELDNQGLLPDYELISKLEERKAEISSLLDEIAAQEIIIEDSLKRIEAQIEHFSMSARGEAEVS